MLKNHKKACEGDACTQLTLRKLGIPTLIDNLYEQTFFSKSVYQRRATDFDSCLFILFFKKYLFLCGQGIFFFDVNMFQF